MLTLTSNEQAQSLIQDGILAIDDDIEIAFDGFEIDAHIKCKNIYSKNYVRNIEALDINALDINAQDINAKDINVRNIKAKNITAEDIIALNINARDIKASDIIALNINANNIKYYALCIAYKNIHCKSIHGNRENAKHFCLDGEIFIEKEKESI